MPSSEQLKHNFSTYIRYLVGGLLFWCSTPLPAAPSVDVKIEGIEGEVLANVELLLSIQQQRDHPLLSAGRIRRLHQKADQEIRTALRPYGYYRP